MSNEIKRYKQFIRYLFGQELWYDIQKDCTKVNLGSSYGHYCVNPDNIDSNSIVYSFGVGKDIHFDLDMIKKFNCRVYAFDPTPDSVKWIKSQNLPEQFIFFDYGISNKDGVAKFFPPRNPNHISHSLLINNKINNEHTVDVNVYKLSSIMSMLKHLNVDIIKMDIEGSEYDIIDDIISNDIPINQLLIEFHHRKREVGLEKTKIAIKKLNDHGYYIFDISSNGAEYSFIKDKHYFK
jgi:FkbM family methyltransferase